MSRKSKQKRDARQSAPTKTGRGGPAPAKLRQATTEELAFRNGFLVLKVFEALVSRYSLTGARDFLASLADSVMGGLGLPFIEVRNAVHFRSDFGVGSDAPTCSRIVGHNKLMVLSTDMVSVMLDPDMRAVPIKSPVEQIQEFTNICAEVERRLEGKKIKLNRYDLCLALARFEVLQPPELVLNLGAQLVFGALLHAMTLVADQKAVSVLDFMVNSVSSGGEYVLFRYAHEMLPDFENDAKAADGLVGARFGKISQAVT